MHRRVAMTTVTLIVARQTLLAHGVLAAGRALRHARQTLRVYDEVIPALETLAVANAETLRTLLVTLETGL